MSMLVAATILAPLLCAAAGLALRTNTHLRDGVTLIGLTAAAASSIALLIGVADGTEAVASVEPGDPERRVGSSERPEVSLAGVDGGAVDCDRIPASSQLVGQCLHWRNRCYLATGLSSGHVARDRRFGHRLARVGWFGRGIARAAGCGGD